MCFAIVRFVISRSSLEHSHLKIRMCACDSRAEPWRRPASARKRVNSISIRYGMKTVMPILVPTMTTRRRANLRSRCPVVRRPRIAHQFGPAGDSSASVQRSHVSSARSPAGQEGTLNKGVREMLDDPSKGSYYRGQIVLSAKSYKKSEIAGMGFSGSVQKRRCKTLQDSALESTPVKYKFRAFVCSGSELPKMRQYGCQQSGRQSFDRSIFDHVQLQSSEQGLRRVDGDQRVVTRRRRVSRHRNRGHSSEGSEASPRRVLLPFRGERSDLLRPPSRGEIYFKAERRFAEWIKSRRSSIQSLQLEHDSRSSAR